MKASQVSPDPVNVLREAALLVAARGKATSTYSDAKGCLCLLAAIAVAAGLEPDAFSLAEASGDEGRRWMEANGDRWRIAFAAACAVADHLGLLVGTRRAAVVLLGDGWSDQHSAAEVVAVLGQVADELERAGGGG